MANNQIKNIGVENYGCLETSRGVAYTARITMDGNVVGLLENEGNGGYTSVKIDLEYRGEFHSRVVAYFTEIHFDLTDEEEYAIYYTFAEHLLDIYEQGEVSKENMECGILH